MKMKERNNKTLHDDYIFAGTDIECFLDTVTYDRQAMIYLGYDVRGFKVTSHSVNNHYRQRTTSTPRGTIQIHIFGTVQGSFNFTLGLVKTSSNPSIQQVAILAYQYRVEHGIC